MADLILPVQKWQPALVSSVTGNLKKAGTGLGAVATSIDVATKAASAVLKLSIALMPNTVDPATIALNLAIEAAKKVLADFSFGDAYLSGLIATPILGGSAAFFNLLNKKLLDTTDPYTPPLTNTDPLTRVTKTYYHAGIVGWAQVSTPDKAVALYSAIKNLMGTRVNGTGTGKGLNMFKPQTSVKLVAGVPRVSWTQPSPLDYAIGRLSIRDGNGAVYATVKSVKEVKILRRPFPYKGEITTKLATQQYQQLVSHYIDTVTSGQYSYAVAFDYELSTGETLSNVLSNWAGINISARSAAGKFASSGGAYPNFYGVKAGMVIGEIEKVTASIDQFLTSVQNTGTTAKAELTKYSTFLTKAAEQITQKITELANLLNNIAGSLDAIAQSGLFFSAYEGIPSSSLAQIASAAGGTSKPLDFTVGFLLNTSCSNQALANTTVDGIKLMLGFTGKLSVVSRLEQLAASIQKAGAKMVTNATGTWNNVSTVVDETPGRIQKLYRFGPNMQPLN